MSIFGSVLSAGIGILGNKLAGGSDRSAASAALASQRAIIPPELRAALLQSAQAGQGMLSRFQAFNRGGMREMEARELERLRGARQPDIDAARARLQSHLLNRGRLGVGVGGGLGKGMFQPETAALEEAILRAQTGDIMSARSLAMGESDRLLNSARGLFSSATPLIERPSPIAAQYAAMPYMNRASATRGFFGALSSTLPSILGGSGIGGGGAWTPSL